MADELTCAYFILCLVFYGDIVCGGNGDRYGVKFRRFMTFSIILIMFTYYLCFETDSVFTIIELNIFRYFKIITGNPKHRRPALIYLMHYYLSRPTSLFVIRNLDLNQRNSC